LQGAKKKIVCGGGVGGGVRTSDPIGKGGVGKIKKSIH